MILSSSTALFDRVRQRLLASEAFDRVECEQGESQAWYQLSGERDGGLWVGLYTPDRWLSESIEAELMHQGDRIEDLLEEELVDQGIDQALSIEHFRDGEKCYVFRSRVQADASRSDADSTDPAEYLARVLLAYEACFGQLGDMSAQDEAV